MLKSLERQSNSCLYSSDPSMRKHMFLIQILSDSGVGCNRDLMLDSEYNMLTVDGFPQIKNKCTTTAAQQDHRQSPTSAVQYSESP
jgi:hypothetical protein